MFSIDPNIPLQAKERDYGRGFDNMQTYQANALKLQQLRDAYDAEKADRLRQKQMRSGIQTDIEQIQRGIPAKYSPLQYQQTPQTGQMPQGMTGVLANERGQNMPQPKVFGEDILAGNFNLSGGDVTQQAQEGRQPTPEEYVQILAKQAMMYGDEKTGFEALKLAAELKKAKQKEAAKWGNNPTKVVNPNTMQPDLMITNDSGEVRYLGASPYEAPMSAKDKADRDFQERKFRAGQAQKQKEYDLEYKKYIADLNKPDPVEKAGAIADVKAEAKIRQDLVNDAANVTKTYRILTPMIDNALTIVKNLPPDMLQSKYQSMLAGTPLNKYLGNPKQQKAITDYNVMLENLRLFIEKPAGSISNYEQGILGRAIGILEGNYSVEQKESVLKQVKGIFDNQNKVAENVLKQNRADKFIYNKEGKPLRFTKEANSQQRREYGEAIFAAKGDSELIREIQEHARELGVLE
jgi:hypothetical protein